jgi:L,D-peptidoglycan transpeptidase YkuD (ErfK/YbiS/YcfS/YnhG family)
MPRAGWWWVGALGWLVFTTSAPLRATPAPDDVVLPADAKVLIPDESCFSPARVAKASCALSRPVETLNTPSPSATVAAAHAEAPAAAVPASARIDAPRATAFPDPLEPVERVVVYKSKRRMELIRQNQVIRRYSVRLGIKPVGAKEFEGDYKTPEGEYRLDWRTASSRFFLAVHVTYPNSQDVSHAQKYHRSAGSAIMVHGLPNPLKNPLDYYRQTDWTDGCIALSNEDMVEFWMLTQNNTPIDIKP